MLNKLVLSVVVAVAVTLGCVLLGALLSLLSLSVAVTVGDFLKHYAGVLGVLAGLWYFFTH